MSTESIPDPLKYILPCTGHSGSTFLCKLLLRAGIKCGHEDVYQAIRESISLVRNPALLTLQRGYQAESSVFSVPFLRTAFLKDTPCFHIVREPWMVIRSWQNSMGGIGISNFFENWIDIYDEWPWDYGLFGQNTRDPNWLAGILVAWNKIVRKLRPESPICKIEDSEKLLRSMGIDYDGEFPSKSTNSKVGKDDPFTLEITNSSIRRDFDEWTEMAGYAARDWT